MNGAAINEMETRSSEVMRLMRYRGSAAYLGEPVSQLEHALQAAWLATQAGSPAMLLRRRYCMTSATFCPIPNTGAMRESTPPMKRSGTSGCWRALDPP
jgi:hypothetical protein